MISVDTEKCFITFSIHSWFKTNLNLPKEKKPTTKSYVRMESIPFKILNKTKKKKKKKKVANDWPYFWIITNDQNLDDFIWKLAFYW